jgi:hypothetical protein
MRAHCIAAYRRSLSSLMDAIEDIVHEALLHAEVIFCRASHHNGVARQGWERMGDNLEVHPWATELSCLVETASTNSIAASPTENVDDPRRLSWNPFQTLRKLSDGLPEIKAPRSTCRQFRVHSG